MPDNPRLAATIRPDVDERLRLLAAVTRRSVGHLLTELLDGCLPTAAEPMRATDLTEWPAFDVAGDNVIGARANRNGQVIVTKPKHFYPWLAVNTVLLGGACLLLSALAVTMGIVSWHA